MPERDPIQDRRRRRVERMLYDWAEADPQSRAHQHGHPSTSPTYRMMREGMPGGSSRVTGRWRHRQRRTGGELTLTPAETCYGRETRSMHIEGRMTGPEADAQRMGTPHAISRIVAEMPADMQAILYARFVEKINRMDDIADRIRRPGIDKNTAGALYRNAIEIVAIQTIDAPRAARRAEIPAPLPIL